jgi:hypothetical protein
VDRGVALSEGHVLVPVSGDLNVDHGLVPVSGDLNEDRVLVHFLFEGQ